MFLGMVGVCFDGIFFKMSQYKQQFGSLPAVIRGGVGGAASGEHAYTPEALLMHSVNLQIALPSTPYDAKGLMKTAIRGDSPVIFCEHIDLYATRGPVPEEEYFIPFGQADIKRAGKDVTIITYSGVVHKALAAAEELAKDGIDVEVVDLRTLVPLDEETMLESVKKTGKVVIVHEAMERGGPAGELTSIIVDKAFDYLDAPVKRVAALNSMIPGGAANNLVLPQTPWIVNAVKSLF
jgi:pyruvate/2-oxoglutarate/acetoin dehydrogenase E1 component